MTIESRMTIEIRNYNGKARQIICETPANLRKLIK